MAFQRSPGDPGWVFKDPGGVFKDPGGVFKDPGGFLRTPGVLKNPGSQTTKAFVALRA